jgi:hypothetical protein
MNKNMMRKTEEAPLSYSKTFVCFANSRKKNGHCIAGKELLERRPGGWIRPVSPQPTKEISTDQYQYEMGGEPDVLDVISVQCRLHQPLPHQPENHLIDTRHYWSPQGQISFANIAVWLDAPSTLWDHGFQSSYCLNNRVPVAVSALQSLYLIKVPFLILFVGVKPNDPNQKRIVRGTFAYGGLSYCLNVTDPWIEKRYLEKADGNYTLNAPVLCISLGEPFDGYFYKLIAAVLYDGRF